MLFTFAELLFLYAESTRVWCGTLVNALNLNGKLKALLISLAVSLYTRKIIFSLVLLGWADENSFIRPSLFHIPFSINYPKMKLESEIVGTGSPLSQY